MDAQTIANFLQDLQSNSAVMRQLGNPTSQLSNFITYLNSVSSCDRTFIRFTLNDQTFDDYPYMRVVNGELKFDPERIGTAIDQRQVSLINRPTGIVWDSTLEEWWVCNYSTRIVRFDNNFSYVGGWGQYGSFAAGAIRYNNVMDLFVNDNFVIVVSNNDFIKCLDKTDSTHLLWDFGDAVQGSPASGRVFNPIGVTYNPLNNTVLISHYDLPNNGGWGLISEHDATTGAYIRDILGYQYDGMPWNNAVNRPYKIRIYHNPTTDVYELWVTYYTSGIVAVFRYDQNSNEYIYDRVYGYTPDYGVSTIRIVDIVPDYEHDVVYFALQSPDRLGAIGLTDADVKGLFGTTNYEGTGEVDRLEFGFYDLRGLAYNGTTISTVDYTNMKITNVPAEVLYGSFRPVTVTYTPDRPVPDFKCEPCLTDSRLNWESNSIITSLADIIVNPPPSEIVMAVEMCG